MAATPPAVPDYANVALPLAQRFQSATKFAAEEKKKQADAETKQKLEADAETKKKALEEAETKKKQESAAAVRNTEVAKLMREWFPKFTTALMTTAAMQSPIISAFNQKMEQRTVVQFNHAQWMTKLEYNITPEELQNFMQTNTTEFAYICKKSGSQLDGCKIGLGYNKEKKEVSLLVDIVPKSTGWFW